MHRTDEPHDVVHLGLPPEAGLEQSLEWAVAHAALAPSEHNSQPWSFRATLRDGAATVDLLLDESRRLEVVDPDQREAVLACGAALLNLRLALAGAGLGVVVVSCPDPERPELLARLSVGGETVERDVDGPLRLAVPLRGTHRGPFESTDVPSELVAHLVAEAALEGAFVAPAEGAAHAEVVRLTVAAEESLWSDAAYRREAAAWSRANSTGQHDGVPGYASGLGAVRSWLQPTLAVATGRPAWSLEEMLEAGYHAPVLLVIGSPDDSRPAVLRAGQAMQRLLLRARAERLAASYLNGSLHMPELRKDLGALVQVPAPQVVVRLGYGELVRPTPRRGVAELLVVEREHSDRRPG
ncbi:MAG: nitroreductase [Frankiales bacterium]|nr:nitroreductase [Frankiales bacterium]